MLLRLWAILAIAFQPLIAIGADADWCCFRSRAVCPLQSEDDCCAPAPDSCCLYRPAATTCPDPHGPICFICQMLCRSLCGQAPQTPLTPLRQSTAPKNPDRPTPMLLDGAAILWPRPADRLPRGVTSAPALAPTPRDRLALKCSWLI